MYCVISKNVKTKGSVKFNKQSTLQLNTRTISKTSSSVALSYAYS